MNPKQNLCCFGLELGSLVTRAMKFKRRDGTDPKLRSEWVSLDLSLLVNLKRLDSSVQYLENENFKIIFLYNIYREKFVNFNDISFLQALSSAYN